MLQPLVSVGGAMGRNKLIYGLADFGVVVSSDHKTGGTWGGAVEALKAGGVRFLSEMQKMCRKGNKTIKLGGIGLESGNLRAGENLAEFLHSYRRKNRQGVEQDLWLDALR